MEIIRAYYYLTKPGIVYSNTIAALAGFLFASQWRIDWWLLTCTVGGVFFIIASACVYNNFLDRKIDARMKRTKKRALVSGVISGKNALIFATVLLVIGFGLISQTNNLTVVLGVIAIISYVFVYGYFKRHSVYSTAVGTIPGALPPVAGYTAVTGQLDPAALTLFMIMAAWQMAHFYAISMFRREEYAAAKLPVRAVVRGMKDTRRHVLMYIVVLAVFAPMLYIFGYTGVVYLIAITLIVGYWVLQAVRYRKLEDVAWARKMFFSSLFVLLGLCVAIASGSVLI